MGKLKENAVVGIAAAQCHVTSAWGSRGQGGVLKTQHSPKDVLDLPPSFGSRPLCTEGRAVDGSSRRSTALDLINLVRIGFEKIKVNTDHSADLEI